VRERILDYLRRAPEPVAAERILKDVLKIVSPNALSADRFLQSIVAGDARFLQPAPGAWTASAERTSEGIACAAVLHFETARGALPLGRGAVFVAESGRAFGFTVDRPGADAAAEVRGAREAARDRPLVAWSAACVRDWNRLLRACGVDPWSDDAVTIDRLAARVLGSSGRCDPDELAAMLGLAPADPERPETTARLLYDCAAELLRRAPAEHRDVAALRRWIEAGAEKVDFGSFAFGPELLETLPRSPGVYVMRNRAGRALYVGKARSLHSRVRSYFKPRALRDPKVARIHSSLYSLEWIETPSELEALLLEVKLIRKLRPPVNLQLEVHEAAARYGKDDRILLVPAAGGDRARVYFVHEGAFEGRLTARLGRAPSSALSRKIRSVYFARRQRRRARPAWEIEIAARWLAANRRRVNFVDVHEAGSCAAVLELVAAYLADPERLASKVYYRARVRS